MNPADLPSARSSQKPFSAPVQRSPSTLSIKTNVPFLINHELSGNTVYVIGADRLKRSPFFPVKKHIECIFIVDEIQEFPKAIQQLRYFYEERPDLYVIAAGSLLEFALKDIPSFPVGRVEYMCIHPLDFEEYLMALGNKAAVDQINNIPVADFAGKILLDLFHEYAIIGGMPEVVSDFVKNKNIAALADTYESIWQSYMDDVEKYARNATDRQVIRHVMAAAPSENDRVAFEFWVREDKGSGSEVDLVFQHHQYIVPIEVKQVQKADFDRSTNLWTAPAILTPCVCWLII